MAESAKWRRSSAAVVVLMTIGVLLFSGSQVSTILSKVGASIPSGATYGGTSARTPVGGRSGDGNGSGPDGPGRHVPTPRSAADAPDHPQGHADPRGQHSSARRPLRRRARDVQRRFVAGQGDRHRRRCRRDGRLPRSRPTVGADAARRRALRPPADLDRRGDRPGRRPRRPDRQPPGDRVGPAGDHGPGGEDRGRPRRPEAADGHARPDRGARRAEASLEIGPRSAASRSRSQLPPRRPGRHAATGLDPARDVDAASAKLVRIGQKATTAGIWLAIVGLPILVALAIAVADRVARVSGLPHGQPATRSGDSAAA